MIPFLCPLLDIVMTLMRADDQGVLGLDDYFAIPCPSHILLIRFSAISSFVAILITRR